MSLGIRTYGDLAGDDASDLGGQVREQVERVRERLSRVGAVVGVASGKGGVGKSLVTAALAVAARGRGLAVALLDADLEGPTAARMLGAPREPLRVEGDGVRPAVSDSGVALMSSALLLEEDAPLTWREPDGHAFVWRGAQERAAFREFLSDVAWGERDLLLVDLPPGSRRLLELAELVPDLAGAVAVTLPSEASRSSVERSLALCERKGVPVLGVVENMSGVVCGECGATGPLFPGDAGRRVAERFGVPLLGRIPFHAGVSARAERGGLGAVLADAGAGEPFRAVADRLLERMGGAGARPPEAGAGPTGTAAAPGTEAP